MTDLNEKPDLKELLKQTLEKKDFHKKKYDEALKVVRIDFKAKYNELMKEAKENQHLIDYLERNVYKYELKILRLQEEIEKRMR